MQEPVSSPFDAVDPYLGLSLVERRCLALPWLGRFFARGLPPTCTQRQTSFFFGIRSLRTAVCPVHRLPFQSGFSFFPWSRGSNPPVLSLTGDRIERIFIQLIWEVLHAFVTFSIVMIFCHFVNFSSLPPPSSSACSVFLGLPGPYAPFSVAVPLWICLSS